MPSLPYSGSTRTVHPVEDIHELISNIDRKETPVVSGMPILPTYNTTYGWQTDSLASEDPDNNLALGADMPAASDTTRVDETNHVQQFYKSLNISDTQEAVKQYGLTSEIAYQRGKKTAELKRNVESRVLSDGTKAVPSETNNNLGRFDGLCTQISTNADASATFSQATLDTLMGTIFDAGGQPSQIYCDKTRKQAVSNFTGTDRRNFQNAKEVINTVERYESDFGEVQVHYHYMLPVAASEGGTSTDSECVILDPSLLELRELQGLDWEQMARTGKAHKELGTWQITLVNRNELGHGKYTGLA